MTCYGGERGIRTHHGPLDSVSCRFYSADVAVNASDAVAPCTGLHRAAELERERSWEFTAFVVIAEDSRRSLSCGLAVRGFEVPDPNGHKLHKHRRNSSRLCRD